MDTYSGINNTEHPTNASQSPIDYEAKFYELNKSVIELSEYVNDIYEATTDNATASLILKKIDKIELEY